MTTAQDEANQEWYLCSPNDYAEITALAAASLLLDFICLRKRRLDLQA